jgi:cell division ATPase FtsA
MLNELNFEKLSNNNENFLDKKFFTESPYREVKEKLVIDIIESRLEELFEIFYKKNINLAYLRKTNQDIYICIENLLYLKNLKKIIEKIIPSTFKLVFNNEENTKKNIASLGAAELLGKGWEKEAIPIIQTKKSMISRFLSHLFN